MIESASASARTQNSSCHAAVDDSNWFSCFIAVIPPRRTRNHPSCAVVPAAAVAMAGTGTKMLRESSRGKICVGRIDAMEPARARVVYALYSSMPITPVQFNIIN
jgi:hypothetical protein